LETHEAGPTIGSRCGVVIATRDRCQELTYSLERLVSLSERPQIVVVDNDSSDGSVEAARSFVGVEVVALPVNLGAAARTVGAQRLNTEFLAFSDDDSWWTSGSLSEATRIFDRHPTTALLMSRILLDDRESEDPFCASLRDSRLPTIGNLKSIVGFSACGVVMRRRAYLDVGGFLPVLGIGGEEALLAIDLMEAGWNCAYADELVVHHRPSPARNHRERNRRVARNRLWSAWLRAPARDLAVETLDVLAHRSSGSARGVLDAILGWREVRHLRRPISGETARRVRVGRLPT
jgi:GT2 family glycosyltransferase